MNTAMNTAIPDVPVPPGARPDSWQDDVPQPYRVLFGELRNTGGVEHTTVRATAVQLADGRIDDGGVYEPPHVYLGDDGAHQRTGPRAGRRANRDSRAAK